AGLVGDDGEAGRLRTGTSGGGDGDQRQAGFADILREAVVAHLTAELAEDADGLGRIDGAAATQSDDGIEITLTHHFHSGSNRGGCGLGFGIGETAARDSSLFQLLCQTTGITELDHHPVGNDQRATATQAAQYGGDFLAGAGADLHQARQDDAVTHGRCSPLKATFDFAASYIETFKSWTAGD